MDEYAYWMYLYYQEREHEFGPHEGEFYRVVADRDQMTRIFMGRFFNLMEDPKCILSWQVTLLIYDPPSRGAEWRELVSTCALQRLQDLKMLQEINPSQFN